MPALNPEYLNRIVGDVAKGLREHGVLQDFVIIPIERSQVKNEVSRTRDLMWSLPYSQYCGKQVILLPSDVVERMEAQYRQFGVRYTQSDIDGFFKMTLAHEVVHGMVERIQLETSTGVLAKFAHRFNIFEIENVCNEAALILTGQKNKVARHDTKYAEELIKHARVRPTVKNGMAGGKLRHDIKEYKDAIGKLVDKDVADRIYMELGI